MLAKRSKEHFTDLVEDYKTMLQYADNLTLIIGKLIGSNNSITTAKTSLLILEKQRVDNWLIHFRDCVTSLSIKQ